VTHPALTPFAPASTELTITDKRVPVHKPGVPCMSENSVRAHLEDLFHTFGCVESTTSSG
jgi:hypothetical protein